MITKNKKLNDKGLAGIEILIIALTVLVLTVILMVYVLNSTKKEKYKVLKKDVLILENSIDMYSLENDIKSMSLKELYDKNLISMIKNPFYDSKGDKYCDLYNSKIKVEDNNIISILQCGDYLIKKVKFNDKATIYKVSMWTDTGSIKQDKYNYSINDNEYFNEYYDEEVFLYLFNKVNKTNYSSIQSIPISYNVKIKSFYREENKEEEL